MADIKGSNEQSTRSRWYRLGCWIWFRISILVLVAILLTAYSVEVYRCSRFTPTGDALFDRYATAVISRQKWILFHGGKHHPTYLPDSLLAQWEDDFGSDPRYWQLRYFCARHKGLYEPQDGKLYLGNLALSWGGWRKWDRGSTKKENDAWKYLQQGVDRGAYNWVTLEILSRQPGRDFYNKLDEELQAIDTAGLEGRERKVAIGEVQRKYEQFELDGLNEIVDASPDQAWPYYWRAKYWFMYGESELALADIKAGNAAPNNEISRSFPVRFVYDRMANGSHLGSNTLAGAIFDEDTFRALPNWVKWKDVYKEALVIFALGGDTEILQELHLAACRLGQAEMVTGIEPTVAAGLEVLLADTLIDEYGGDMSPLQRMTMRSMGLRARVVYSYWQSWSDKTYPFVKNYPRLRPPEMQTNVFGLGIGRATIQPPNERLVYAETVLQHLKPRLYYNRAFWVWEQRFKGIEELNDTFEQLEYVNLNTLEWPQEWGDPY